VAADGLEDGVGTWRGGRWPEQIIGTPSAGQVAPGADADRGCGSSTVAGGGVKVLISSMIAASSNDLGTDSAATWRRSAALNARRPLRANWQRRRSPSGVLAVQVVG